MYLRIEGSAPGLPLWFIATGEMANNFAEGYTTEITAKDRASGNSAGQVPHPPDMNFDRGSFDNLEFIVELFSGCLVNGRSIYRGAELTRVSETLFKIAMPQSDNAGAFVGPPLVTVSYGNFWRARGLFQKVRFISQGCWDAEGFPMHQKLSMEFSRHFGQGSVGNVYGQASEQDLRHASATAFRFRR